MAEKINMGNNRRGPGGPRGMMRPGEKSKDLKGALNKLLKYMGIYKWPMMIAAAFAMIGVILNLIGPDKLKDITKLITDGLFTGIDVDGVMKIIRFLITIYIIGAVLTYCQSFITSTVSQRFTQKLRSEISRKINRLPLKYFDSHSVGDVLSRVTNDIDTVGQGMNQSFTSLVTALVQIIGSLFMMYKTNWILATAGVLTSILGFVLMFALMGKSQKYFIAQQLQLGNLNGNIEEIYSGHLVVKAYNGEKKARAEFEKLNDALYNSAWKSQFLGGIMMPIMGFIGNLAYVVVCVTGAALAIKGIIGFETIVAFMMYIRFFTQPLQTLGQAGSSVQSVGAAAERVFEFLGEEEMAIDEPEKNSDGTVFTLEGGKINGSIDFEHVKFGYDPEKIIIHDFTHHVKPGQKIAIVGPTGAGKTTLVNLLMRFYEINAGKISIDGHDTKHLTRENIHGLFGMVLQDTWLFEGTLRDNIVYGKEGVTDERLDEVCAECGISDWVSGLPNGYDTVLGDNVSLSAGQKQLVTIARAMVENAPLLILDEATSSVDTRTELQVQKAMDKLTNGRTSFVIAHRLSTIKNADCILVLKDGDIIESGSHNELIEKHGFYADLYNSQFEQVE